MSQLASYPSLKGKNVFVTGGGSGIGEEIVASFVQQGAWVAFVDIDAEASGALCARLAQRGLPAPLFRNCDIRDIDALKQTMSELAGLLGDFDVLINNAANDQRHSTAEVSVDYWNDRIAINQRPMFFACQAVFEGMKRKGGGAIINVSSISWHNKSAGYPVYATSKAAVIGLTRGLAREYGAAGIRVNTLTPGWVMTQRQLDHWVNDEARKTIRENQCLPEQLMPQHLASMALFLAADDSAMCTAQEFIVDAGWV